MAKQFYDFIFARKREEKLLDSVKQFCFDSCILSGHNPKVVDASLFYVYQGLGRKYVTQIVVAKQFGISTVSLRNTVKRLKSSEHWSIVKVMLMTSNVDRKV